MRGDKADKSFVERKKRLLCPCGWCCSWVKLKSIESFLRSCYVQSQISTKALPVFTPCFGFDGPLATISSLASGLVSLLKTKRIGSLQLTRTLTLPNFPSTKSWSMSMQLIKLENASNGALPGGTLSFNLFWNLNQLLHRAYVLSQKISHWSFSGNAWCFPNMVLVNDIIIVPGWLMTCLTLYQRWWLLTSFRLDTFILQSDDYLWQTGRHTLHHQSAIERREQFYKDFGWDNLEATITCVALYLICGMDDGNGRFWGSDCDECWLWWWWWWTPNTVSFRPPTSMHSASTSSASNMTKSLSPYS